MHTDDLVHPSISIASQPCTLDDFLYIWIRDLICVKKKWVALVTYDKKASQQIIFWFCASHTCSGWVKTNWFYSFKNLLRTYSLPKWTISLKKCLILLQNTLMPVYSKYAEKLNLHLAKLETYSKLQQNQYWWSLL